MLEMVLMVLVGTVGRLLEGPEGCSEVAHRNPTEVTGLGNPVGVRLVLGQGILDWIEVLGNGRWRCPAYHHCHWGTGNCFSGPKAVGRLLEENRAVHHAGTGMGRGVGSVGHAEQIR